MCWGTNQIFISHLAVQTLSKLAKRMNFDRVSPQKTECPSKIVGPSEKAEVEAVVRPGKNFFDGELLR